MLADLEDICDSQYESSNNNLMSISRGITQIADSVARSVAQSHTYNI